MYGFTSYETYTCRTLVDLNEKELIAEECDNHDKALKSPLPQGTEHGLYNELNTGKFNLNFPNHEPRYVWLKHETYFHLAVKQLYFFLSRTNSLLIQSPPSGFLNGRTREGKVKPVILPPLTIRENALVPWLWNDEWKSYSESWLLVFPF